MTSRCSVLRVFDWAPSSVPATLGTTPAHDTERPSGLTVQAAAPLEGQSASYAPSGDIYAVLAARRRRAQMAARAALAAGLECAASSCLDPA